MTADFHLRLRQGGVGDAVALSALVRDLDRLRPGCRVAVTASRAADLFRHDPRVVPDDPARPALVVPIDFKAGTDRSKTDRTARYIGFAHEEFERGTGIRVPLTDPRPEIRLGPDETAPQGLPYGVVASGAKMDMPVKRWVRESWDETLRLAGGRWVQVGQLHDGRLPHLQDKVAGAEDMLGRTTTRQLVRLVAYAEAVLCHCSLPMLLASAFGVPCVAVGGGRESPWMFDGLGVTYLHTVGEMDCCRDHGCHTSSAHRADTGTPMPDGWLCTDRVLAGTGWYGRCMTRITPGRVAAALAAAKSARTGRSS